MLQQIRRYLRQEPFIPFEIHCSNGEVFVVEDPDAAAALQRYVTIELPDRRSVATISEQFIVSIVGAAPFRVPARTPRTAMMPRSMYAAH